MTFTCWPPDLELWEQTEENGWRVDAESVEAAALAFGDRYEQTVAPFHILEVSVRGPSGRPWSVLVNEFGQADRPLPDDAWNRSDS